MDPKEPARKYVTEFREFLLKTNLFSMAMGVVIGTAVSKVVDAVVRSLVMPVVGVVTPSGDWTRGLHLDVWRFHIPFGEFLRALLDFLIIAVIVFLITRILVRGDLTPLTKPCRMCLEPIHAEAKRCKFCTSEA